MNFRNHFVSISTWLAFAGVILAGFRAFAAGEDAKQSPPSVLTIAAAADLKFALDDLVKEFEAKYPATKVNVTYGSSGNFFAQFQNGAPFDLFFSADIAYPLKLAEKGLGIDDVFLYAIGCIVVWAPKDSPMAVDKLGIKALLEPSIRKIAVANPEHAPYGRAAVAALKALNVYDQVASRLVYGENIAQTAQFVQSGAADVGIRLVADAGEVVAVLRGLCHADRDLVALHFLNVGSGVFPIVTAASGLEAIGSLIENLLIDAAYDEFRPAMETYNDARGGDPFARTPRWNELRQRIGASLPTLPKNTEVVIIPGSRLSDLPIHLCPVIGTQPLAVTYSYCYVPNLIVLQAIRDRRARSERGATWKPSRCGAVTSWKAGDDEETKRTLIEGTARFIQEMESANRTVTELVGAAATPTAFLSMARSVDLLRIACHGIGKPDKGRHGFLLGDGNSVSPGLTDYVLSDEGSRFILEWEEIEGPTAPMVFSCSCSSGSSSYTSGGERVGLDRALLLRGTEAYVAPFWDVVASGRAS